MKYSQVLLLAPLALAAPAPSGHQYIAPGAGDVRSPCPGLNSLANHGFIPRNGRGMSLELLNQGLKDGMNVGTDFTIAIGGLGIQANPNPLATSFDLDQLDQHNFPIEHDGSLSRQDIYESGNDYSFNQDKWNEVLAYFQGKTTATIKDASLARYNRIQNQRAIDGDKFIYGARQLVLSTGETALYLSTMGNPTTGDAPVSYVKSLFENERLPYELGWTKPTEETNLMSLGAMVLQIEAANPEVLPEGLSLGAGTLKDVYELKDPITGKLLNATCLLANAC